jgi:hypothetical protein
MVFINWLGLRLTLTSPGATHSLQISIPPPTLRTPQVVSFEAPGWRVEATLLDVSDSFPAGDAREAVDDDSDSGEATSPRV